MSDAVWRVGQWSAIAPGFRRDVDPAVWDALVRHLAEQCSAFAWSTWHRVPARPATWTVVEPAPPWSHYVWIDDDGVEQIGKSPDKLLVELDTRPATRAELSAALASEIRRVQRRPTRYDAVVDDLRHPVLGRTVGT